MTKGILVFASNNSHVDYVKQAYFLAQRAKEYLGLPTTIVTDSGKYLRTVYEDADTVFDNVIPVAYKLTDNVKAFNDGALASKRLEWKNDLRPKSYEMSPYDETLVLDTDVVISNNSFLKCFDNHHDLLMYKDCVDITGIDRGKEFETISDTSVDFYWATVIFFRKSETNKVFFDLVQHIQENWKHYSNVFQLSRSLYRNDFAFSMAIHVMNGYQPGNFVKPMPGSLYYITDKSILWSIDGDSLFILLEKPKYAGEYTAFRIKDANVHVMNKFSLNRCIDEQ
jgi:hypothetical protein